MKKVLFLFLFIAGFTAANAQLPEGYYPVNWTFSAKKIADKSYEVHLVATVDEGWHVFSQTQPDDAIADPTNFVFNPNLVVKLKDKVKEVGKMEKFHDKKLGISANQYGGKVDFVQVVELNAAVKTNLTGTVSFQACNDEKCLKLKKVNFNIPIQ